MGLFRMRAAFGNLWYVYVGVFSRGVGSRRCVAPGWAVGSRSLSWGVRGEHLFSIPVFYVSDVCYDRVGIVGACFVFLSLQFRFTVNVCFLYLVASVSDLCVVVGVRVGFFDFSHPLLGEAYGGN